MKFKIIIILVFIVLLIAVAVFLLIPNKNNPNISPYVSPPVDKITANWITISESGRYFVFEDGNDFFPIGTALNGAYITYDATEQEFIDYFKGMKASGENFVRIDTEGFSWNDDYAGVKKKVDDGTITFLENPAGAFNEEYAKKLDRFFKLAQENDVYVELLIFSHSCTLSDKFDLFPYYKGNGGPITKLAELRSNSEAKDLFKQRLRYISDRWGNSPNLFMYELYNEIEWLACGAGNANDSKNWVEEMGNYLRDYEKARYGKSHLIGVSAGLFELKPEYRFFLNSSGTDVLQTHYYYGDQDLWNPVKDALRVRETIPNLLNDSHFSKPYLENERYPIEFRTNNEERMHETQDYFVWSYLTSGASGGGALWHGMRVPSIVAKTSKNAEPFLKEINFARFSGKPDYASIESSDKNIIPFLVRNENTLVGWLMNDDSQDYSIEAINLWRDERSNGTLPPSKNDYLFLMKWKSILESQNIDLNFGELQLEISNKLQSISGIDKNLADEISTAFFDNTKEIKDYGLVVKESLLQKNGTINQAEVKTGLGEILDKIRAHLESLETKYSTLKTIYQGHPKVSTTITLSNLADKNYTLKWYDSTNGTWISEEIISGHSATFKTPEFSRHIAFIIKLVN
ncbi:MAG TPA: cellulase family glycosylhydrolase [Candidatus Nanoarchaeia archaeon]|nr:cellulase family glycosylhydrolase [Candidatus Nanoarchaeia archaeon]